MHGRTPRLSLGALDRVPRSSYWTPPAVDPRSIRVGLAHLGIGAFARAHPVVYTELAAAASGASNWGIVGVTQRSAAVRDQLAPQDGLYSVLERGPGAAPLRVVGSLRDVVDGAADTGAVSALIADPGVQVVTLTVTEKGYRRAAGGRLELTDPLVAADLAGGEPASVVGRLVSGLQSRRAGTGAPLTILSCDNLVANGAVLQSLVADFCDALPARDGEPLRAWLETSVRFPSCMVDRIVPAATEEDRAAAYSALGLHDRGLVVAEPYAQWVVEDDFAGPRPAWELAGAVLTDDVAPWETVKLRMLNATHSLLAYLGALRGYATIVEAVADDDLAAAAESLMTVDVTPTLTVPDGLDLAAYRRQVLDRFANPDLRHTTRQVAMDGSQKLPVRLLGTVRDRLAAGVVPEWAALGVAAWMTYVARCAAEGSDRLDDPLADRLVAAVGTATSAGQVVDSLLGVREVFGTDLPDERGLRDVLVRQVGKLMAGFKG